MRIRELIGYPGSKTIADGYIREARSLHAPTRSFQRPSMPPPSCASSISLSRAMRSRSMGTDQAGLAGDRRAGLLARDRHRLDFLQARSRHLVGMGRCIESFGALPQWPDPLSSVRCL